MSCDLLNSINKIKSSVNEKDEVLWEFQAAEKCYSETTEKLRDECDQLSREIKELDDEIAEIEPQIKTLSLKNEVEVESLPLNQEGLINQQLYKNLFSEKIKTYQEDADKIIDEYEQHIQNCKEKLELTNPTCRILQAKRTELKQCKIRCMDLQQKIVDLKRINRDKIEIRRKLFYSDIIKLVQYFVFKRKYLNAIRDLEEETKKEKEYLKKLSDITELLKQKDMRMHLTKQRDLPMPQMEFSASQTRINTNAAEAKEKDKTQVNNVLSFDIKTMLERADENITNVTRSNPNQKLIYNSNNAKVRILENKTIKLAQDPEKPYGVAVSKEERNKQIEAKIQKVVQNFNKSISRQNSKKSIVLSQKKSQTDKATDNRDSTLRRECKLSQGLQSSVFESSGATQAIQSLNLKSEEKSKRETFVMSQEANQQSPQTGTPKQHLFNRGNMTSDANRPNPNKFSSNKGSNKFSQNTHLPSQMVKNKAVNFLETMAGMTAMSKNTQFSVNFDNRMESGGASAKPAFKMCAPGFGNTFGAVNRGNPITFPGPSDKFVNNDNSKQANNISLDMSGYKPEFTMDITDDDYEAGVKSPDFLSNFISQPEEEGGASMAINPSGVPNFIAEPLFSFGQSKNPFSFK
ncbi:hypothetical protein NQ315_010765 [Exocentrus adspersus]|uniref:Uncharacterized protein n=1 Tax=Exocentrus adspersus TaxID=1586481 RepID=A0AAV8VU11_9CUCU|nr:hypothetical protein NQ315_010765 [Exocentrus adspersus]